MSTETTRPLGPADTARLIEFARACKAAVRAVVLYPKEHPAISATLGRIVQLTAAGILPAPLRITVLANSLKLDGQTANRLDPALSELASLLHHQLVGEMIVRPGGDLDAWRTFLLLLGRPPDEVRAEGGIARLWTTLAGRHVELREIDYAEALRERIGDGAANWSEVIAYCVRGESGALDEHTRRLLIAAAGDVNRLTDLIAALDAQGTAAGRDPHARTSALVRLFDRLVKAAMADGPEALEPILANIATALGQLSPDMMIALLEESRTDADTAGLVDAVVRRMSEHTIASFVARQAAVGGTSIERLAEAFQTLVPEDRRERVLSLARDQASGAAADPEALDRSWETIAQKLLTSYSDADYVSKQYGRELSSARTTAIDVEQVSDDPPDRLAAWLGSVSASELRRVDLALISDLLRIERDPEKWATLMHPVVALIEDLLLVGDFEPVQAMIGVLVGESLGEGVHRRAAGSAVDALVAGSLLQHTVSHLATVDDQTFDRVKAIFLSVGEGVIRPLAEALTDAAGARTRERLAAILIAFGVSGRREVERLKGSPSAAVRRTAIYLLREFGGSDALAELTALLDDPEPQLQREAVRAILGIGTERAYAVLSGALTTGTASRRESIMTALGMARDERAAPLLAHIVDEVNHRGRLAELYLRAVHTLGSLKATEGVEALTRALQRGEWWAPRRTVVLREAVAASLARMGTPEALHALEQAAISGGRGVRRAARTQLVGLGTTRPGAR